MSVSHLLLNHPDAIRSRELAVHGQAGIRWQVVGVNSRGSSRGREGRTLDRALVTLRSVPNGKVSGMPWSELRRLLVTGAVVIL